jgi:hypothetical protein
MNKQINPLLAFAIIITITGVLGAEIGSYSFKQKETPLSAYNTSVMKDKTQKPEKLSETSNQSGNAEPMKIKQENQANIEKDLHYRWWEDGKQRYIKPGDCNPYRDILKKYGKVQAGSDEANKVLDGKIEGTLCSACVTLDGSIGNDYEYDFDENGHETPKILTDIRNVIKQADWENTGGGDGIGGQTRIFVKDSDLLLYSTSTKPKGGWDSQWVQKRKESEKCRDIPALGCFDDNELVTSFCLYSGRFIDDKS